MLEGAPPAVKRPRAATAIETPAAEGYRERPDCIRGNHPADRTDPTVDAEANRRSPYSGRQALVGKRQLGTTDGVRLRRESVDVPWRGLRRVEKDPYTVRDKCGARVKRERACIGGSSRN